MKSPDCGQNFFGGWLPLQQFRLVPNSKSESSREFVTVNYTQRLSPLICEGWSVDPRPQSCFSHSSAPVHTSGRNFILRVIVLLAVDYRRKQTLADLSLHSASQKESPAH
jgi:hypothetical protein